MKNELTVPVADMQELSALPPAEIMRGMAVMLKAACDRIEKLERMVSRMQTVTSAQAAELNDAVRRRSRTLCEEYRLTDMEAAVNAKIRRDIKSEFGGLIKETSRDDFNLVRDWIAIWEDTDYLRSLRQKCRRT